MAQLSPSLLCCKTVKHGKGRKAVHTALSALYFGRNQFECTECRECTFLPDQRKAASPTRLDPSPVEDRAAAKWGALGAPLQGNFSGKTTLTGNVNGKTTLPGNLIKGSRKRKNIPLGRDFELSKKIIDQQLKPQFVKEFTRLVLQ